MLVLECIPHQLAEQVTQELTIPVIGIGAGSETDGQVLVYHDTVKYGSHHLPKFVQSYAEAGETMQQGLSQYVEEVKSGAFPKEQHRFTMKEEELEQLYGSK